MGIYFASWWCIPSPRTTTQQPGIRFAALSPNLASTKSANFTALYCRRCLKSIADALRICLEMWGRIRGNPSEVIRKAHGADLPSHDVCLSCKWGQVYVTYSQEQELIKELISHWQSRVDQWLFISLQSNKLFKEDFKQTI